MTQRMWGEKFNCGRAHQWHVFLIIAIVCVLSLPVIFYPAVRCTESSARLRVIAPRDIHNFLEESRRRLSFNRRTYSMMENNRGGLPPTRSENASTSSQASLNHLQVS